MTRNDERRPLRAEAIERLERVFTDLSRQPFARVIPAAPPDRKIPPGRARLQGALSRAGRIARRSGAQLEEQTGSGTGRPAQPGSDVVAPAEAARQRLAQNRAPVSAAHLVILSQRLERIEQALMDLKNPLRATLPARDLFREWIRAGHWEEVRFGDYLRLRRAGLI